jgi:flagellar hook protein FlgE
MMRSLYAGVSGLQNHQTRMDVLGNNIANVNTTGFKKGRVTFQDMLSQTISGAARPTAEVGGVNPKQVGLGMTVASIDTIHTQGSLQTTGVGTDVAIQGDGYFVLTAGDRDYFTRNGAFGLDRVGTLVNPANGMRVQGWQAETVGTTTTVNTSADVGDLVIPVGAKDPAAATGQVDFACNLDRRTDTWTTTIEVYDSFGTVHLMRLDFLRLDTQANRWQVTAQVDPDAAVPTNPIVDVGGVNSTDNVFVLDFDNLGALAAARDGEEPGADAVTEGALQVQVSFDVPGTLPAERQTLTLNLGELGGYTESITQFSESSSTKAIRQNGYGMGYLESFKVDQSGVITGVFSNGQNRLLGQLAMASFTNPGGLDKAGDNTYVVTNNSGDPNVGPSGIAGKGKIIAGALEMSNVDLAEQFTDMIVTQRGFQANSRTITTADQMLQELLTLKR